MTKITGALFDMDGTILDSGAMWAGVGPKILRDWGYTPKPTIDGDMLSLGMDECAPFMKQDYRMKESVEEINRAILAVASHYYHHESALKPGAMELLQALHDRGIPMAVTTATDLEYVEPALERCGVLHLFDAVLTCPQVGRSKHHPDIFRLAMAQIGAEPAGVWLFEDALYSMETAKREGLSVCAVEDEGARSKREEIRRTADCYLTSLTQWRTLPFAKDWP